MITRTDKDPAIFDYQLFPVTKSGAAAKPASLIIESSTNTNVLSVIPTKDPLVFQMTRNGFGQVDVSFTSYDPTSASAPVTLLESFTFVDTSQGIYSMTGKVVEV